MDAGFSRARSDSGVRNGGHPCRARRYMQGALLQLARDRSRRHNGRASGSNGQAGRAECIGGQLEQKLTAERAEGASHGAA